MRYWIPPHLLARSSNIFRRGTKHLSRASFWWTEKRVPFHGCEDGKTPFPAFSLSPFVTRSKKGKVQFRRAICSSSSERTRESRKLFLLALTSNSARSKERHVPSKPRTKVLRISPDFCFSSLLELVPFSQPFGPHYLGLLEKVVSPQVLL